MSVYYLGLDLGQAADYSALAILEGLGVGKAREYQCRHLQRWPLRTPYPAIVADTEGLVKMLPKPVAPPDVSERREPERREPVKGAPYGWGRVAVCPSVRMMTEGLVERAAWPALAVDATGVGAPVVDLFKAAHIRAHLTPIQITGGDAVTEGEGGLLRVPKRDLVSVAQVALQTGRLKIAAELPEAATLATELQNFQVKISAETAHDSYGAWREGAHDDLVLAVALALWIAENGRRPGKLMTW